MMAYLIASLELSINRTSDVAPNAKGSIGYKSDTALSLALPLSVKDGCSKKDLQCTKDRTGYELCDNI